MEGSTQAPRRSMSADLFSIRRLLYNLVDRIFIFLHHLLDSYWRTSCIFLYHPMAMDNGIYPSQIVQPSSSAYLSRKEISCILYLLEASVYMAGTSCQSNVFFDGLEKEKKKCNRQGYSNLHATQNSPIFMHRRSRSLPSFVSNLVSFPMKRKWPRP